MVITVQYARELDNRAHKFQRAQDRYMAISGYMEGKTAEHFGATRLALSWDFGSATTGYKEVEAGVRAEVVVGLFETMQKVLRDARQARDQALAELEDLVAERRARES